MTHLPDAVRPPYYKPKKRGPKPKIKTEADKQNEKLKRSISAKIAREYKNGKLLNLAREILAAENIAGDIEAKGCERSEYAETIAAEFRAMLWADLNEILNEEKFKILISKIKPPPELFAAVIVGRVKNKLEELTAETIDEMEGDKKDISENLADEIAEEIRTGKTHENKPILAKRINAAILDEIETRLNDKINANLDDEKNFLLINKADLINKTLYSLKK